MKYILIILMMLGYAGTAAAQDKNENYDAALAKELGADDYGMKTYVFVMLTSGGNTTATAEEQGKAFRGHQDNIRGLAEAGKMILAGPYYPNDDNYRGLFILDVATIEEAKELMKGDPAITSDILSVTYYQWYGSAALKTYMENSEKIWVKRP